MSNINNQQRHAQLQAQMTVSLTELRAKVAGQMLELRENIQKRPQLKGDNSLQTVMNDPRISKDESGSMVVGALVVVPGLSNTMDAVIDVAVELYDSRKAAFARPQDKQELSFKQIASIREKNRQDVGLFATLGDKLNLLDTYIASGYSKGMIIDGSLLPLENGQEEKLDLKEKYKPDNQNYKMKAPAPKFAA